MERVFALTYTHTCGELLGNETSMPKQEGTIFVQADNLQSALSFAFREDLVPRCVTCGALYSYLVPSHQK
jgi:hypothetical protein